MRYEGKYLQLFYIILYFLFGIYIYVTYICSVIIKQLEIMKEFTIEYRRENGTTDTETVFCKTSRLTKSIKNYFYNINAEILTVK